MLRGAGPRTSTGSSPAGQVTGVVEGVRRRGLAHAACSSGGWACGSPSSPRRRADGRTPGPVGRESRCGGGVPRLSLRASAVTHDRAGPVQWVGRRAASARSARRHGVGEVSRRRHADTPASRDAGACGRGPAPADGGGGRGHASVAAARAAGRASSRPARRRPRPIPRAGCWTRAGWRRARRWPRPRRRRTARATGVRRTGRSRPRRRGSARPGATGTSSLTGSMPTARQAATMVGNRCARTSRPSRSRPARRGLAASRAHPRCIVAGDDVTRSEVGQRVDVRP